MTKEASEIRFEKARKRLSHSLKELEKRHKKIYIVGNKNYLNSIILLFKFPFDFLSKHFLSKQL